MKKGINFFGPYESNDSIGMSALLNIESIKASKIDYKTYLLPRPHSNRAIDYEAINTKIVKILKYKVNMFHFNARRVPLYFSQIDKNQLSKFYNIGFWVHEMQSIPDCWAEQIKFFDEIWTPSSFCQASIANSSNKPVIKLPYGLMKNKISNRILNRKSNSEFNFLSIFDVNSDAERKNPFFTIRAFLNAHSNNKNIRLIFKLRNLNRDSILKEKLNSICKINENIKIIDSDFDINEINQLYENTDAYVSLHRAEGFGLTIAEAMSRGIPIIATGYSGNMEYCNSMDSRLVNFKLVKVGKNRPRYRSEDLWAEPDLEDATLAFKELVNNNHEWLAKAAKSKIRLDENYSFDYIGQLIRRRINLIDVNFKFDNDMHLRTIDIDIDVGVNNTYNF